MNSGPMGRDDFFCDLNRKYGGISYSALLGVLVRVHLKTWMKPGTMQLFVEIYEFSKGFFFVRSIRDVFFLLGFDLDPMLYFCFFSGLSPQNFKVDFCFLDVEETKEFVRNFHKIIPVFI